MFKVGDVIERVGKVGKTYSDRMWVGRRCTVTSCTDYSVVVDQPANTAWNSGMFTLVSSGAIEQPKALDKQEGGGHYKDMAIQPIEYTLANKLGFCEGNVVKYISRYKNKNGIEDLKKAKHYIDLLIEDLEWQNSEQN